MEKIDLEDGIFMAFEIVKLNFFVEFFQFFDSLKAISDLKLK